MKRFALIGRKLGHSYSQRWFEEMFAREGLADYSYRLVEMASLEGLKEWVLHEGINGFNVTVPYKQEIIAQLDTLDESATAIGAVNCVTVENGKLIGHNTDAPAFRETLENFISPFTSHLSPLTSAYILGTGGAAHAVAYALDQLGILYTFVSRTPENYKNAICYNDLPFFTSHLSPFTLLVNATPVGMYPDIDATPLDLSPFTFHLSPFFVYDLIYNPSPTRLLREAADRGAKVKDGLEMLHRQAELSWKLFQQC